MQKVQGYKCDYCSKVFSRPVDATNHEVACNNRKERRHCRTCVHGVSAIVEYINNNLPYHSIFGNTSHPDIPVYGAWCNLHEKPISDKPYFIDCDFSEDYYGRTDIDHPIPGTCEHYDYKGYAGFRRSDNDGQ